LKKQKVEAELIVDYLQSLIAFRDRLLEFSDMKMPADEIDALLDDAKPVAPPNGDKPSK